MAEMLKGAPVAAALCDGLRKDVASLLDKGVTPCLAVVRAGARADDLAYQRGIQKRCETVGVRLLLCEVSDVATTDEVAATVRRLAADPGVHGILVMRPLPQGVDDEAVCGAIPPGKDVDGVTTGSMARVYSGRGEGFPPCTAEAVVRLLDHYAVPLKGARVVIVGRSLVIGRPAALLLLARGATVTLCHTGTKDLAAETQRADVVVAAAGRAEMIREEHLAPGCVAVDVGINVLPDGRMVGDVDAAAATVCAGVTPVPGGVGAVTSAVLLAHVIEAAKEAAR